LTVLSVLHVATGMTELDMNGSHAAQHGSQQAASLHRGGWEGAPAPAQVTMPLLLPRARLQP
jgi:hypothetical protein